MINKYKIAIIGYGYVGKTMHSLFFDAIIYDKYLSLGSMNDVNKCDVAFICVPTPSLQDGSCDTKEVEEVINSCECDIIVIRSTVPVGFSEDISKKTSKNIIFQPEYCGETSNHPYNDLSKRTWLTFGGDKKYIDKVVDVYKKYMSNSDFEICMTTSSEAEMAKYMSNVFLAMKVTFSNEIYDLCEKLGISYEHCCDAWLHDSRIGASHTKVYKDKRGFSGKCFPKDIHSLENIMKTNNCDSTLISAVIKKNNKYIK